MELISRRAHPSTRHECAKLLRDSGVRSGHSTFDMRLPLDKYNTDDDKNVQERTRALL